MAFIYSRTVRFQDTDAAGVVYFANGLAMCHEAYEASLAAAGIDLKTFFRGVDVAIPIAHASMDFWQPLYCGDRLEIHLTIAARQVTEFEIAYQIFAAGQTAKPCSRATTRHVCIDPLLRSRRPLPDSLMTWMQMYVESPKSMPSPVDG
ncbi:MAG: thioesterase family protein [Leptolyngbyaceae cyanobacterium bins.349]|nr:thioesterase family protein [Leptolyngbyaceae cyanobacterium bins.349]